MRPTTDRQERKVILKDWMTSTTEMVKVSNPKCTSSDISFWWRENFGIKMTDRQVEKALYGNKKIGNDVK